MHSIVRNSAAAAFALAGFAIMPAHSEEGAPSWTDFVRGKEASMVAGYQVDRPNLDTLWNIQKHFGVVPKFFELFPEGRLPAMWNEYKNVHLNPDTALDAKTKRLIALAVAAQADCGSCIYFQASAAFANGASFQEVREAVAIFAIEDDWSRYLTDESFGTVKQDVETLRSIGRLLEVPVQEESPYATRISPAEAY
jgi:AhpD family alkylhydroperoxidase